MVMIDTSKQLEIFINGEIQAFSSPFRAKLMLGLLMRHYLEEAPWWRRYVMSYDYGIDYGVEWYNFRVVYPEIEKDG